MKTLIGTLLVTSTLGVSQLAVAQTSTPAAPAVANQSVDDRARAIVDAMTLDEQINLMRTQLGLGMLSLGVPLPDSVPAFLRVKTPVGALGSAGYVPATPRVGLPALQMSDASLGVANLGGFLRRGDEATSLPATLALASTFDPDLARQAGDMLGSEARAKGFNVQLAGGVNLTREPRNGRNFEYAGEDPLLSGLIVGSQVAGIQTQHVVSTVKHYAANSQETGRTVYNSVIDEAALRESDLLAFEIAIERGQPGAVMCAYNKINGPYACESPFLLGKVLKGDWGYRGWVMSDWGANHSLGPALDAGLDQESPQDNPYFADLKAAVERGEISKDRVRASALRIVRTLAAVGALDNPAAPGGAIDKDGHAEIAERIALSGMVLLKNDGVLPLAATAKKVVVIGGFADKGVLSGGGSSQVMPYGGHFLDVRGRTGLAAILAPVYGNSSPVRALKAQRPDADIQFDDGADPERAAALAKTADVVIVFATRPEQEGVDSAAPSLPFGQDALVEKVAAAAPHTIVVLETGNPILMPWLGRVSAVLQAWYPGQRGGEAIAKILTGQVSPSGRLPMTFPASIDQVLRPKIAGIDKVKGEALGFGDELPPFDITYEEGGDVGYRWFERTGSKPLYAFGYGLTYTTFAYGKLKAAGGEGLEATFTLTNTGSRAGVEVAQLYAAPPGRTHRLVGWSRVALEPGQSKTVTIKADPRLLASWNAGQGGWRRAGGSYRVFVGKSAASRDLAGAVSIKPAASR